MVGTSKNYTPTGFGPRKNKKMAGVDYFLVYMQTAVKNGSLYIHHPGGAAYVLKRRLILGPGRQINLLSTL